MAVIDVQELFEGRKASEDVNARRRYTRVFEVRTDDPQDAGVTVKLAAGLPARGQSYATDTEFDTGALAQEVNPVQHGDDPTLWTVTVEYDSDIEFPEGAQPGEDGGAGGDGGDGGSPADKPKNPLDQALVWKFSFQQTAEAQKTAYKIDPDTGSTIEGSVDILNSAGDPFDPPVMAEVSRPVASVTINRPTFSLSAAAQLQDAMNDATWKGLPPRTARCIGVEATSANENGLNYWQVTYTFAIKYDNWDIRVLDAGWNKSVYDTVAGGGAKKRVKITDSNGREPTAPVPLTNDGEPVRPGDPVGYKVFRVYREVDFGSLIL